MVWDKLNEIDQLQSAAHLDLRQKPTTVALGLRLPAVPGMAKRNTKGNNNNNKKNLIV